MRLWKTTPKSDPLVVAALANLEGRVEALERNHKVILLEWEDMFDRFRRLYAKISKRAKEEPEAAQDGSTPAPRRTTNPLAARLLAAPAGNWPPRSP